MNQYTTILVVDDEPLGRTTIEQLLRFEPYTILHANNGLEALDMARQHMPDIVLMDVMMPEMDGLEACRRLRAEPLLAEMPILLITALDDRDTKLEGLRAGADEFITKPFDRIELRTRLQTIMRLNRYRRLLSTREQFSWVVDNANEGYVMLDQHQCVVYANTQARRYLNLPATGPDINTSGSFVDYVKSIYHCEPKDVWENWPASAESTTGAYLILPESAGTAAFWLHVQVLPSTNTAIADTIVRLRDVTTQMAIQRDMRGFHSAVWHKLRTPLASIQIGLNLLEMHTAIAQEDFEYALKTVESNIKRLRGEIEDILQYSRLTSLPRGELGVSIKEFANLADRTAKQLSITSLNVVWQLHLDNNILAISYRAAEIILWELLENARKFHPEQNPTVEIIIFRSGENTITLQFRDNGIHLSPEQLVRAWQPYHQNEPVFTGEQEGMGLGLATVASLVWGVRGTCDLRNCLGRAGVEVELQLPEFLHSTAKEIASSPAATL